MKGFTSKGGVEQHNFNAWVEAAGFFTLYADFHPSFPGVYLRRQKDCGVLQHRAGFTALVEAASSTGGLEVCGCWGCVLGCGVGSPCPSPPSCCVAPGVKKFNF